MASASLGVACFGVVGIFLRWGVQQGVSLWMPGAQLWATMVINVVGSLMLGALMGLATRQSMAEPLRVAMSVGLLGGFTTFSAFSWDCWLCFSRGEWGRGIALLIGTPLLGVLGAAAAHRWILAH